jgi:hypothetical protein
LKDVFLGKIFMKSPLRPDEGGELPRCLDC